MLGYNQHLSAAWNVYKNLQYVSKAINAYDLGYWRAWATAQLFYDVRDMFKDEEKAKKAVDRGMQLIKNISTAREMQLKQSKMY